MNKKMYIGLELPVATAPKVLAFNETLKKGEGSYDSWLVLAVRERTIHPFAVWLVADRPEGLYVYSGTYCQTLEEARESFMYRGGVLTA